MKTMVQARLDEETRTVLGRLVRANGWSVSKAVREGIHALAGQTDRAKAIKIIGLGKYDSGITDLASNKKHLAGLGVSSMSRSKVKRTVRGR